MAVDDIADPATIRTRAEFGAALSALREAAGLTVRELARQVARPPGTLGGYLSGRHVPSPSQQSLIVDVLATCGVRGESEVEAWMAALRRVRASSDRRTTRSAAPYRGLKPFEPEDAALFFGRREQTDEIVQALHRLHLDPGPSHGVLAVIGPSGSGKSSLLRAGVVAAVRGGALDSGAIRWTCTIMTPGDDPRAALVSALAQAGDGPHVVVVDQFEEVFTLTRDPAVRASFLDALAAHGPDVVVALGMRADFFAEAAREPALLAALRHAQIVVGPMSADQVREAVVGPAVRIGAAVEDGLAEVVLADLAPHDAAAGAHDVGSLPLLSHALLATWDRSSGRRITIADYRATGGLDAAVQRTAEDAYSSLDEQQRATAHDMFVRLVNVDDDVALTRRRITRTELGLDDELAQAGTPDSAAPDAPLQDRAASVREVIDRFVECRLLTLTETTVEVSHEALLTAWPRLRSWLDTDRAGLVVHRRITTAANAWNATSRDPASLFTGVNLATAAEWAAAPLHRRLMTNVELAFVDAGLRRRDELARAERRRTRRLAQLLAAVAVLALVASGLAVWARTAQSSADHAQHDATSSRDDALSRQVAIQARQLDSADPALAQQLALAAYRVSPTAEARGQILDETARPLVTRVLGAPGPTALATSADGTLIAVGHADDGSVHLYRRQTNGRPPVLLAVLPGDGQFAQIFALAFTPDGRTLASGGQQRSVQLWDVAVPTHPRRLTTLATGFTGSVQSIAVSPDGRTLAAGSTGPSPVRAWDVSAISTPHVLAALRGVDPSSTAHAVVFSPDGTRLVAGLSKGVVLLWPVRTLPTSSPQVLRAATATTTVNTLAFAPRADLLVVGDYSGTVSVWSLAGATPRQVKVLHGANNSPIYAVAVSTDGSLIAAGYADNSLRQWQVDGWQALPVTENPGPVTGVAYTANPGTLMSTAADGTLRLVPSEDIAIPVDGTVFNIGFTADSATLLVSSNGAGSGVRLWDVRDRAQPVARSPLLTVPATLHGKPLAVIDGSGAITSDGRLTAAGTGDGHVALWDTSNPAHPHPTTAPFAGATQLVETMAFSPDNQLLAVAADDHAVSLWNVHDPAHPALLSRMMGNDEMLGVAFSPDGRQIAGASADDHAYLWDISHPTAPDLLATLGGFKSYVYGVAFSPNGRRLAATSSDHTTRLWDIATPRRPTAVGAPLIGPTDYVYAASFDPSGNTLAVASNDSTVRLYDLRTRSSIPAETLRDNAGAVFAVQFSPDGKTLVAAGRAAKVSSWALDPTTYARALCTATGDPITRQEWSLYVPGARYDPPCGKAG